ncbi:recombinase family protein [Duganella sp. OV510]|uniref:recombinase family protein n=1 Tax=Duganella sp. OV510 TaxID=1881039 RepID=UPI0027D83E55|nr:recombinase family protein [Duganella sp. OV510]
MRCRHSPFRHLSQPRLLLHSRFCTGKMMLTMLAAVAEMECDLLLEHTQAGLARAKSEGKGAGSLV